MLELTANPNIILPGMLALIAGVLVSREIFGKESVYVVLMKARGLDYRASPLTQTLRRIGVASVMERNFESLPDIVNCEQVLAALAKEPRWIIITRENQPVAVMPAADLARQIVEQSEHEECSLTDMPAERLGITSIDFQSTLHEAISILDASDAEALYVTRHTIPGISRIYGVLTREDIDRSYSISP